MSLILSFLFTLQHIKPNSSCEVFLECNAQRAFLSLCAFVFVPTSLCSIESSVRLGKVEERSEELQQTGVKFTNIGPMIWPSILKVKMELRICSIQLKFVSIVSMILKEKVKVMIVGLDWIGLLGMVQHLKVHQHRTDDLEVFRFRERILLAFQIIIIQSQHPFNIETGHQNHHLSSKT